MLLVLIDVRKTLVIKQNTLIYSAAIRKGKTLDIITHYARSL